MKRSIQVLIEMEKHRFLSMMQVECVERIYALSPDSRIREDLRKTISAQEINIAGQTEAIENLWKAIIPE